MPGIDRTRIIYRAEFALDQLTCGICQGIFDEPVVTQCCSKIFCKICINEWLNGNNTCPNDCQQLDSNGLTKAPRIIYKSLDKLKIKCENYSKCHTILTIKEIKNHMNTCFNCNSCKALKSSVVDKERENQILRKMVQKLENEVKLVIEKKNIEIELLKQELYQRKEMTGRFRQLSIAIANNSKNQEEVIQAVRGDFKYALTVQYGLTELNKTFLVEIATRSVQSKNNFFEISKDIFRNIKANNQLKYFNWMVFVHYQAENLDPFVLTYNKALYLNFNGIQIRILGFNEIFTQKAEIELAREKIHQHRIIDKSDLTTPQIAFFVEECKIAIDHFDEYDKITKHLADKLKKATGAKWIVLAFSTSGLGFHIKSYKKILLEFGRIKIRAYKTHLTISNN